MYWKIRADNFFYTTLATEINATDKVGTFELTSKIVNGYTVEDGSYMFWMIVGLNDPATAEVFRITNVAGTVLTYDKRISPTGMAIHAVGSLVNMQASSDFVNWLSNNTDDFGYTETVDGSGNELKVKVYGGRIHSGWVVTVDMADSTLTLPVSTTQYIYFDNTTNTFWSTTVEPVDYYVVAKVITNDSVVLSIEDYRGYIIAGSGGSSSGWHIIKNTDQAWDSTTLTQRAAIRTKKLKTTDDGINLETVIEGKRIATPDVIPTGDTEYIEENTQMIVEWSLDIQGTLVNDGKLILI